MQNEYEIRGSTTAIFLRTRDGRTYETLIDTDDLSLVDWPQGAWYGNRCPRSDRRYVIMFVKEDQLLRQYRLHRLITKAPIGYVVDHINHDTLDNRRNNLRVVTNRENLWNRSGPRSDAEDGVGGVHWHRTKRRWEAEVWRKGSRVHLGTFGTREEAQESVLSAKEARVCVAQR